MDKIVMGVSYFNSLLELLEVERFTITMDGSRRNSSWTAAPAHTQPTDSL
jgi:hypothetical protein